VLRGVDGPKGRTSTRGEDGGGRGADPARTFLKLSFCPTPWALYRKFCEAAKTRDIKRDLHF